MNKMIKLRDKIIAFFLGFILGVTGLIVLEWWNQKELKKLGYRTECYLVKVKE